MIVVLILLSTVMWVLMTLGLVHLGFDALQIVAIYVIFFGLVIVAVKRIP